jgi:uncharacterized protein (TIGR02145 family)
LFNYTEGNGGSYSIQSVNSSGVIGLTANLTAGILNIGNGTLTYEISGTPTSVGVANFAIIIGGKTCNLTRNILPIGVIASLDCASATNYEILTADIVASSVNSIISYTGGNGGKYNVQSIVSTGVTGLTATLSEGIFKNGSGSLTFIISGTPSTTGTASFAISIGGKTCALERIVGGYGENITDIEGNTYKTVYIGVQHWMAENLKVSMYNDGSDISNGNSPPYIAWSSRTNGAWCYYNNSDLNNPKYGKLYNWYAVSPTTNGNKNVCPSGWHVPSVNEYILLTDYLGGSINAGSKMKEIGTTSWSSLNTDATNLSLFTGIPGGIRGENGYYESIGDSGFWWLSNESGNPTSHALFFYLNRGSDYAGVLDYPKARGFSVRCLKD